MTNLIFISLPLLALTTAFAIITPQASWPKLNAALLPGQSNITNTTLAEQQLAAGIGFNIMAQQGEVAVTTALQQLQQQPGFSFDEFNASKTNLLTFVTAGIQIRQQNQMLSKVNEQVARGLAQIEQAQVMEFSLTNKLTGNPSNDGPILQQLQQAFQGGIMRNMGLMSLATGGSDVPMAVPTQQAGGSSGARSANPAAPLATLAPAGGPASAGYDGNAGAGSSAAAAASPLATLTPPGV